MGAVPRSPRHKHEWRLMRKSDISTRFKDAPPTRETLIDLVLDPGYSTELWTCPECGEDRFKYRPGFEQVLAAAGPPHTTLREREL